jgi:hypothetical protein
MPVPHVGTLHGVHDARVLRLVAAGLTNHCNQRAAERPRTAPEAPPAGRALAPAQPLHGSGGEPHECQLVP